MTGLVGMDVATVQQVGKGLQVQATAITQLTAAVQGIVDQLSASWRGQDAQQFAAWWQQQHRPALQRAAQVIDGLGQSALNNAAEQEGASSGGSSSATAGPVVGVAPAPEAAPAPHVPEQPTAPPHSAFGVTSEEVQQWRGSVHGRRVGDGWCVALFTDYHNRHTDGGYVGVGNDGGAKDYWERPHPSLGKYYDRIPADGDIRPGDVVIYGATSRNSYGHIGIVTGVDGNGFTSLEQNVDGRKDPATGAVGSPAQDVRHSGRPNVIGFLRPKP